jgi:DNA-binding NtrC family response regulator
LFVDNEPAITTMLKMALEHAGFSIDVFNDPENKLAAKHGDKVETLCKEEGNEEVANRLLTVMQNSRSKRYDPSGLKDMLADCKQI